MVNSVRTHFIHYDLSARCFTGFQFITDQLIKNFELNVLQLKLNVHQLSVLYTESVSQVPPGGLVVLWPHILCAPAT
jgi:hypothetical protein